MPEKPVECSQCKKTAKVVYKEIVGTTITTQEMCSDCPILLQKLHGTPQQEPCAQAGKSATGLYCGHCHTPLEAIKMGGPIGCVQCYTAFGDMLCAEFVAEGKIAESVEKSQRNQPLHVGKTPDGPIEMPTSNRLTALNEALNEALKKENYEEAAWLRDQIKALVEKKGGTS